MKESYREELASCSVPESDSGRGDTAGVATHSFPSSGWGRACGSSASCSLVSLAVGARLGLLRLRAPIRPRLAPTADLDCGSLLPLSVQQPAVGRSIPKPAHSPQQAA